MTAVLCCVVFCWYYLCAFTVFMIFFFYSLHFTVDSIFRHRTTIFTIPIQKRKFNFVSLFFFSFIRKLCCARYSLHTQIHIHTCIQYFVYSCYEFCFHLFHFGSINWLVPLHRTISVGCASDGETKIVSFRCYNLNNCYWLYLIAKRQFCRHIDDEEPKKKTPTVNDIFFSIVVVIVVTSKKN